jgi:hypothetical protein
MIPVSGDIDQRVPIGTTIDLKCPNGTQLDEDTDMFDPFDYKYTLLCTSLRKHFLDEALIRYKSNLICF